jgi:SEC-C motif-containing protein
MMRSRYAAFALKLVPYLYETFHSEHEDRKLPRNEVMRGLRDAAEGFRYMGLRILDTREDDERGEAQVLFYARLFERGHDRSFVELSEFRREGGGWRYLRGYTVPIGLVRERLDGMTIDTFPGKKERAS